MEMMLYRPQDEFSTPFQERMSLPTVGTVAPDWRKAVPALGGSQLILRELEIEDAPSLLAHLTTEEVTRFISPPPTSVEGFEKFIRWTHRRRAEGRYLCFGIVPAGHTAAVGMFQIHVDDTDAQTAEWGFVLGAAYWGTGLFVLGARHVVDFAFAQMGLHRLVAYSAVPNGRGNGALRKIGAVLAGLRHQSFERHGLRLDQMIWTIARGDWWAAATTVCSGTVH